MDWVLNHIQLIIFIAGVVAWWLNQRSREKAGKPADYDDDGTPEAPTKGAFDDPELAERTRKIRDEIQRKIEERRRAGAGYTEPARPAAVPVQTPVAEEPPPLPPTLPRQPQTLPRPQVAPPLVREVMVRPAPPSGAAETRRMAEMLEQQAAMAEHLRLAQEMKAAAEHRTAFEEATADHQSEWLELTRSAVIGELRERDAVRRAIILREILGPPVGLRR